MSSDVLVWLLFAAYGLVPLVLVATTKLSVRLVAALGFIAVLVEWGVAFDDAQEGAGDHRGAAALALTGLFAFLVFGGLWALGTLAGWLLRRRRANR